VGAFGRYRGREGRKGLYGEPWKPFGRTGHRYDEIITTDFQEIEWSEEIDWIGLMSVLLMGCCEHSKELLCLKNEENSLTN